MQKTFQLPKFGIEVEIGKLATQADGSVFIKSGNNAVLSTAVMDKKAKEFMGFFPLMVEYREKSSAAGKFPGGYVKREGRLSDNEVLTSRLIDRPIRPLFPAHFFNEVQLISTVYSYDGSFPSNVLAMIGSSLALTISQIPFLEPIGAVQASKVGGKWKFNVSYEESLDVDSNIIIAGTKGGICMVEGHCNNIPESELVDLMFEAHALIQEQVQWQLDIQKEIGEKKVEIEDVIDWKVWEKNVVDALPDNYVASLFVDTKEERSSAMSNLRTLLTEKFSTEIKDGNITENLLMFIFDSLLKKELPDYVAKTGKRVDGRSMDKVRPITVDVGLLPCVHGSSVFKRGETQALSSLTIGTGQDAQKYDRLIGEVQEKTFMLHYNFPPFSTGEVRMIRGVGRREIGHGYLAENSFQNVLPKKDKFPYTVRSVVDILSCNGSSSMATVCATTMALMDGGVPISDMVGGIAMGLFKDSAGKSHVVTDILGLEDAFGLMDFKITGTQNGVMAIQMDIKEKAGLTKELLASALEQARAGRLHILGEMKKVMTEPRSNLSDLAPRVCMVQIDPEKIGAIIGPGGRIIKEIIAQTGTQIDIADDDSGSVMVYSKDVNSAKAAVRWIKILSGEVEVGATFQGIVRRIVDFGVFVELVPGKDGLVHISSIAKDKQRDIEKLCKLGSPLKVKVTRFDAQTGRINLEAPELK